MKRNILLLSFFLALFFSENKMIAQDNLIVLIKYKAQQSAENKALEALNNLINQVKTEPNYVKIVMHVDPSDKTNILLYEEWENEEYYKGDHMKTPHLQKFISDSKGFLAGPPEISYWQVRN